MALIVKWWCRFRLDPLSIWAKVITGLHKLNGKPDHVYSMKTLVGVWNNIACIQNDLDKKGISHNIVLEKRKTSLGVSWNCVLTSDGKYKVNKK